MESIITQIISKFNSPAPNPHSLGEGTVQSKQELFFERFAKLRILTNKIFWFLVFVMSIWIAFFAGRSVKFLENKPSFTFESKEAEGKYFDKKYEQEKQKVFQTQGIVSNNNGEQIKVADIPTIVASKGGKKYYFVWCKGAENIRAKNKRTFKTEDNAKQAGYTLAASCK